MRFFLGGILLLCLLSLRLGPRAQAPQALALSLRLVHKLAIILLLRLLLGFFVRLDISGFDFLHRLLGLFENLTEVITGR